MDLKERTRRAKEINRVLCDLFPYAKISLHFKTPWEWLVAVQLSAQCTDKKVNEVTVKLFKKYPTLVAYLNADPDEFAKDIYSTGFYKNKTKNILASARMIKEKFNGKIPKTMKEMLSLPGVARKTANVVLGAVYGVVDGIAVDTHVLRLSHQGGLTTNKNPVKVERDLLDILPRSEWFGWTYKVIEYGRKYSPATKKSHKDEPLAQFYIESK